MTDWRLKIFAYLHDPPDKPLALLRREDHEAWGFELAGKLAGDPPEDRWTQWKKIISRADQLASGADRSAVLPRERPSFDDLRHPLSGQHIDLSSVRPVDGDAQQQAKRALEEEFEELRELQDSPPAAFLALWGLLPERLRVRRGEHELRGLWDLLPAETRMPNHPVAAHQSLVSALATILGESDEAALLSLSVGPVQRFIAQARRTADLWGGSALLSRALLEAVLPVVEELGPDHVLFPVLRRSRLFFDQWLLGRSAWADRLRRLAPHWTGGDEMAGGLPNRFLAVVPARRAAELAGACEERMHRWWEEFVEREAADLEARDAGLEGFSAMARSQARGSLRVSWAASSWPAVEEVKVGDESSQAASWLIGGGLPDPVKAFVEEGARGRTGRAVSAFRPNGGALYGSCYETTERLLAAVKLTRVVFPGPADGLKCSLCGERGVVAKPLPFEAQKALWSSVRERLGEQQGLLRRGEALCGVCWAKRQFAYRARRVPSTAEVAATPFKRRVLAALRELEREVAALCNAVDRDGRLRDAYVLPMLLEDKNAEGLRGRFARVPGEVLMADPREDREAADEEELPREVLTAAAALRRAAAERQGIAPPRPYLAVLMMDGDEMGKWLSGARNLSLGEYLSLAARAALEAEGCAEYLTLTWPMTPALHGTLSEACAVFSQRTAPRTLHQDGLPAFLVYSGGDDVLALTAVGCHDPEQPREAATEAALRLRLRFSGHVRRDPPGGDVPDPAADAGYVLDPRHGLALAFGNRATASVGLAVFHHRWPLGRALVDARRAEETAKKDLGRNALCITILRRSGQVTRTGLRFEVSGRRTALASFQHLCHAFAFGGLSPRLLAEVRRRLDPLHGGLPGDQLMDLARPLVMQAAGDHFSGSEAELNVVRGALQDLSWSVGEGAEAQGQPPDAVRLSRWLDLIEAAAFLGRGGEP